MSTTELEQKVLANGMKIEEIPLELRTEKICINAMKWVLESPTITCPPKERQEMCFQIMSCFPKEILLYSFVRSHLI